MECDWKFHGASAPSFASPSATPRPLPSTNIGASLNFDNLTLCLEIFYEALDRYLAYPRALVNHCRLAGRRPSVVRSPLTHSTEKILPNLLQTIPLLKDC